MRFLMILAAAAALTSPAFAQSSDSMKDGSKDGSMSGTMAMPSCKAGNPVVWVNTDSKIYFTKKSAYYGKTKMGKYVCRNTAEAMGAHKAKSGSMSSEKMSH